MAAFIVFIECELDIFYWWLYCLALAFNVISRGDKYATLAIGGSGSGMV